MHPEHMHTTWREAVTALAVMGIITFLISGRPKETRLALLKELNARIVAGAGISPDDLMIQLSEDPGENVSFGQGLAQRAFLSQAT